MYFNLLIGHLFLKDNVGMERLMEKGNRLMLMGNVIKGNISMESHMEKENILGLMEKLT
jgi:hypothetical protein